MLDEVIHGDCVEVLKDLPRNHVDLICTDPPYGTGNEFSYKGSSYSDKHDDYIGLMVEALSASHEVLKDTGSLYLQCDDTYSHYLKVELDKIFGRENFVNELIWRRNKGFKAFSNRYGRNHDVILYYRKSDKTGNYKWNKPFMPHTKEYLKKVFSYKDDIGNYNWIPNLGPGSRSKNEEDEFMGYSPSKHNCHWSTPTTTYGMGEVIRKYDLIPNWPMKGSTVIERLQAMHEAGLFKINERGNPVVKYYQEATRGIAVDSIIDDIKKVSGKERINYPTQKPINLYSRFIESATYEGDIVLDPFCGSGTTLAAAKSLNRHYIGIDSNIDAIAISQKRLDEVFKSR